MPDDFKDDLRSLMPRMDFSRRGFVTTSLAAGFALGVQPIQAQSVITTDTTGLEAGEVQVPTAEGRMPAYRAAPASGSGLATIVVIQEIWGVHEHIRDVCRRFAKLGYFAVAPELYARHGDPMKLPDNQAIIREIVSKVPDAQVMSDIDATVAWAQSTGRANTDKLGITGFCWGGRITWLYAAHSPKLKAGVAWYGRVVGNASPLTPKHPVDLAADIKAPVLGLYGGADAGIPNDTVAKMEAALKAAGKTTQIVVYPDTPHAFHADYRPSYREAQAKDGWARAVAWFKQHGVA
ncbi:MAG: dienelactone hydrolase family protein [Alphaproteobacteria bacterium]